MEKKLVSFLMLTLLLAKTLMFAFNIQPVRAGGTIHIRADGSVDPSTAPISSTDNVTYTFADNIYDQIQVEKSNIVIDGNGYTVQGTGAYDSKGISLSSVNNVTIKRANIKYFWGGFWLSFSSGNNISGNNITANKNVLCYGMALYVSLNNTIAENNITNTAYGIVLWSCSSNSIYGNNITNNGIGISFGGYSSNNKIYDNNIANKQGGISLDINSSGDNIYGNNITDNSDFGIRAYSLSNIYGNSITNNNNGIWIGMSGNCVFENNIANNDYGIYLYSLIGSSAGGRIYHNNFIDNAEQVHNFANLARGIWDEGYPSGGNYWSDHVTVDDYSGVNQDELGSDGIVDEPYIIDDYNRDHYPLAQPWSPAISATVDIDPDTLNLESEGRWITAYVELPEAYDVYDIDVSSVMLNDTIPVEIRPAEIGDFDNDGIPDLMVKFDRAEVESFILDHISLREAVRVGFTTVTLTITGELTNGTPFQGSDTIKIVCTPPQKL